MTDSPQGFPVPLPGIGEGDGRAMSDLEGATRRTIAGYAESGLLDERHAMVCQLLLELSRSVAAAARAGRASAAAMASAQILAALESLPKPPEGGGQGDDFDRLADELREAALRNSAT